MFCPLAFLQPLERLALAHNVSSYALTLGLGQTRLRALPFLSPPQSMHTSASSLVPSVRSCCPKWGTAGVGLGTEGQGIVTSVESKLRPKGMGIAFKGFKEKTEQSKAEARR